MKAIFTTVLLLLITFSIANANVGQVQKGMSYNIALMGHYVDDKMENTGITRSLPTFPIQAFLNNAELFLEFSSPITELTVTLLKDDTIIACHQFISIEAGKQEVIDLSGFEPGEYQVLLTTPTGSCLSGHFVW